MRSDNSRALFVYVLYPVIFYSEKPARYSTFVRGAWQLQNPAHGEAAEKQGRGCLRASTGEFEMQPLRGLMLAKRCALVTVAVWGFGSCGSVAVSSRLGPHVQGDLTCVLRLKSLVDGLDI